MDENEIMTPEEPEFDPEYWEQKRREEREAQLAPFRAVRAQLGEHDNLMADALYEITLLEFGAEEV